MINVSVFRIYLRYLALGVSILLAGSVIADVNLSTGTLNASLKQIQRISLKLKQASPGEKSELIFQLGTGADDLALQLTKHMDAFGNEQKGLIDLVLNRTAELDVVIRWHADKKRYFYDGAAFTQYLEAAPAGPSAAESAYQVLEAGFFQSSVDKLESLLTLVKDKQEYLERYKGSVRVAEVMIMLVIEYRDLSRIYQKNGNTVNAINSIDMARTQARQVIENYPGTDKAGIAGKLLESIEDIVNTLPR